MRAADQVEIILFDEILYNVRPISIRDPSIDIVLPSMIVRGVRPQQIAEQCVSDQIQRSLNLVDLR